MRIAIVGSEEKHWNHDQKRKAWFKIMDILEHHAEKGDMRFVSGGCHKGGVDIWAEVIASTMGIPLDIYFPEKNQWEPNGYKDRNDRIAQECEVLYCIDPSSREWSGGRWTMKRAEFYGKETHLILVEENNHK